MSTHLTTEKIDDELKVLKIIFIALLTGIFIFGLISFIIISINGPLIDLKEYEAYIIFSVMALYFICLTTSGIIYRKKLRSIQTSEKNLSERLIEYRKTLFLTIAIIEIGAFACIIGYLLTGFILLFIFIVNALIMIFIKAPWVKKNQEDAGINIY